jgi:hypothetical protein
MKMFESFGILVLVCSVLVKCSDFDFEKDEFEELLPGDIVDDYDDYGDYYGQDSNFMFVDEKSAPTFEDKKTALTLTLDQVSPEAPKFEEVVLGFIMAECGSNKDGCVKAMYNNYRINDGTDVFNECYSTKNEEYVSLLTPERMNWLFPDELEQLKAENRQREVEFDLQRVKDKIFHYLLITDIGSLLEHVISEWTRCKKSLSELPAMRIAYLKANDEWLEKEAQEPNADLANLVERHDIKEKAIEDEITQGKIRYEAGNIFSFNEKLRAAAKFAILKAVAWGKLVVKRMGPEQITQEGLFDPEGFVNSIPEHLLKHITLDEFTSFYEKLRA